MASIPEVAKRLDLSERHVKTLIDSGVLKRAASGQHDLDAQTILYIRHLREVAAGRSDSSPSLTDARTRSALANAESTEMKTAKEKGELVSAIEMSKAVGVAFSVVKTRVLAMPHLARTELSQFVPPEHEGPVTVILDKIAREAIEDLNDQNFVSDAMDKKHAADNRRRNRNGDNDDDD
jgi:terminase small subunit / prophage DNA-packing protein